VKPSKKNAHLSHASSSATARSEGSAAATESEAGSSLLALLEHWWPGDANLSTDTLLHDMFSNWREVLQSDNFLIFVLTIALGVVLYIRSERQYLQAPPPMQAPQ
jgi:succinate dehydrogenase hydrophobic anchor subunit